MKLLYIDIHTYEQGGAAYYAEQILTLLPESVKVTRVNCHTKTSYLKSFKDTLQGKDYDVMFFNLLIGANFSVFKDKDNIPYIIQAIHDLQESGFKGRVWCNIGGVQAEFITHWSNYLVQYVDDFIMPRPTQSILLNKFNGVNYELKSGHKIHIVPFFMTNVQESICRMTTPGVSRDNWVFPARIDSMKRPTILHEFAQYFSKSKYYTPNVIYAGMCEGMSAFTLVNKVELLAKYDYIFMEGYTRDSLDQVYSTSKFSFDFTDPRLKDGTSYTAGMQYTQFESILYGVLPVVSPGVSVAPDTFYEFTDNISRFPFRLGLYDYAKEVRELGEMSDSEYIRRVNNCKDYLFENHTKDKISKNLINLI